jgi:putative peptide zinc metalloprotease protein
MHLTGNVGVRDTGQLKIALREDLLVSVQSYRDSSCYVIEDPVDARFFRLGIPEGSLVALLDGTTSLRDAIRLTAATLGEDAFSEDDAMAIVRWLIDCGLAYPSGAARRESPAGATGRRKRPHGFNPLSIRIPLLHPDRVFQRLLPWSGWLFARPMWIVWAVLCGTASWQLLSRSAEFTQTFSVVFAPGQWLSLLLVWIGLKVVHECSHALVCKMYGGRVSEAGLMILWGAPVPYVDATSSWGFGSKWQKIHTAAAGLYSETLIAAMSALLWSYIGPGSISCLCLHIVLIAGLNSFLFNANPLMRFDGYYILMDLLEMPNLAASSRQFWGSLCRKYLWGMPAVFPGRTPQEQRVLACYGLAAWVWQWIVFVGLAVLMFAFLPIDETWLLACAATFPVVLFLWRLVRNPIGKAPREGPPVFRVAIVSGLMGGVALLAIFCLPWPGGAVAPAVVEYAPLRVVRAYSPGFVKEIRFAAGEEVKQGQVLAILGNDALEVELADLKLALEDSLLNLRICRNKQDNAGRKAELERYDSIRKQLREKLEQVARLTVRSPVGGKILTRQPESLLGRYLRSGNELVAIGDEFRKELRISISQDNANTFLDHAGQEVQVHVRGGARFSGKLARIEPRASLEPAHPALTASEGGPLPVKPKDAASQEDGSTAPGYELLVPRFTGQVALTAAQSLLLGAGQRGVVSVGGSESSIGVHVYILLTRWCRDRARQLRAAYASR